jgi:glycerol uptake facilitator-like aquaporin
VSRWRRAVAEALGTGLLLAVVVGSGIMAERLAGGNVALALLANAIATGAGLIALILMFGAVSGAHLNPAVSLGLVLAGHFPRAELAGYVAAQGLGGILGVWTAHAMFGEPILQVSDTARPGLSLMWSEFVAAFGLVLLILSCLRGRAEAIPYAVAAYITAAYWFTASTSFANPAVTVARALSDTFAGIRPLDAPGFIAAQLLAAVAAARLDAWLHPSPRLEAPQA